MSETLTMLALKAVLSVAQMYGPSANPLPTGSTIQKPQSLGDAGEAIIRCYHPTGHLTGVASVERPWSGADAFNARSSVVLRLDWTGGFVGMKYSSLVALMERNGEIKTVMLRNGTPMPPNPRCQLAQWTRVES